MHWQPIETVPKDGTEVIGGYAQDDHIVGLMFIRWDPKKRHWTSDNTWVPFMTATHWMHNPPLDNIAKEER